MTAVLSHDTIDVRGMIMLLVFTRLNDMNLAALAELYMLEDWRRQDDFFDGLREGFFKSPEARYYVFSAEGVYLAALRMERTDRGLLISGLQVHSRYRRRGYGLALMRQVLSGLSEQRVFSHVSHDNQASKALHIKVGFCMISDTARLLDGTVTSRFGTYVFDGFMHKNG